LYKPVLSAPASPVSSISDWGHGALHRELLFRAGDTELNFQKELVKVTNTVSIEGIWEPNTDNRKMMLT
jgi:hypothetical protein